MGPRAAAPLICGRRHEFALLSFAVVERLAFARSPAIEARMSPMTLRRCV
jgi:hypothetical protein